VIFLLSLIVVNHFNPVANGESAEAYLFMTPPMYVAEEIGEIFDIVVDISDVENLHSCELTVTYNTSLLNVTQVIKGDFFPQQAAFEFEKNELYGFVTVNMSLSESDPPLSGNGTLAQLTFEVTQAPATCAESASVLKLDQIRLHNPDSEPIAHKSVSAIYFWRSMQPDPPIGERLLDLYTQKGGEGPDEPSGYFVTFELVHLTSNVTYNGWPEQRSLVPFQVLNPLNQTVLVIFSETDEEGLAGIAFRIPEIPESIGLWTAISTVEIAGEVVWDTISFWVFYMPVVGGYTFPIEGYRTEKLFTPYLALVAILTAVFTMIRRKTHKGLGQRT